jgi:phospholipase C
MKSGGVDNPLIASRSSRAFAEPNRIWIWCGISPAGSHAEPLMKHRQEPTER